MLLLPLKCCSNELSQETASTYASIQSASLRVQDFTGKGLQRPSTLSLRSRRMLCCKNPLLTLLQQLQLLVVAVAWFRKLSDIDL